MRLASRLAAGQQTPVDGVLLGGDLTNLGTATEARLFTQVFSASGAPVVAIGGNHDDAAAMAVLGGAGYRVLRSSQARVAGVSVYGESDPLAYSSAVDSDVPALAADNDELLRRLQALPTAPQVLLVHDERQATGTIDWARGRKLPLTVIFGNDHLARVERQGSVVLVDSGTGGASGYGDIGAGRSEWYTFQLLDFARADGHLLAVTTLSYSIDGRSRVDYLPMGE